MTENEIGTNVLEAAIIGVHRDPGPGLLEIVHVLTLAKALSDRRLVPVAIHYNGIKF